MKKLFNLFLLFIFLISPLFGEYQIQGNFKEITLDKDTVGKTILLPSDSMAVIKLPSIPSSGYRWEVINYSQIKGIARELSGSPHGRMNAEYEIPANGEKIYPGSSFTQIIRIVGEKTGNVTVTLALKRSWESSHIKLHRIKFQVLGKFTGNFSPRQTVDNRVSESSDQIYAPGLPAHWDWREQNGVTPVKNQFYCGSCWAFASAAVMEAKILIKDGVTRDLSEQYIINCNDENWGCRGGFTAHEYHWFKSIPGVSGAGCRYESEYPYEISDSPCQDKPAHEQLEGWAYCDDIPDSSGSTLQHIVTTAQLKQKIYDYGPVTTVVCSGTWGWYTGGVHTTDCTSGDHQVLVTGWDDTDGCFYIKNSWGTNWGENGYIRLAYNTCVVGRNSTYVLYEKTNPRIVYRSDGFREDKANPESIGNSIEIGIKNSTTSTQFSRSSGFFTQGTEYTVTNLPASLSMSIQALNNANAVISLSGNFPPGNDVTNLTVSFLDAAFTGNNAAAVENSTHSSLKIEHQEPYKIIYKSLNLYPHINSTNPSSIIAIGGNSFVKLIVSWYDSATEPNPNNNQCLKIGTSFNEPFLTTTSSIPSNIKPIAYGTEIGPNSTIWTRSYNNGGNHTIAGPAYHDLKGGTHYLGFNFLDRGYTVYGWVFVEINADGTDCRLIDLAWQQNPNKTILAGQTVDTGGTPPTASFTGSPTTITEGGFVSFSDTSTGSPTSWSWSLPGGTPSTSTAQSPNITYNTAGTYNVTLTVSNAYGSNTMQKTSYITVNPSSISYCASNGNTNTHEWIESVQIHFFTNYSGKSSGGYEDNTSQTIALSPGLNAGVYLTPGFDSDPYTEYWNVWIDFNKNGSFDDPGENVFSGSGSSMVSGSFFVPSNANGSSCLRVSMRYYTPPTSCGSFEYGEVEDYTVSF